MASRFQNPTPVQIGAAVSSAQAWNTTLSNAGNAVAYLQYERVGANLVGRGTIIIGSSLPTGTMNFTLPTGLTADFSGFPKGATNSDAYQRVGYASSYSTGGKSYNGNVQRSNTSTTQFQISGSGATYGTNQDWTSSAPVTWANGDAIMIGCTIPIAEWAGNGTVNLGAGAQVEYASNSSTSTSADDTTSFAYGPAGNQIQNITAALKRTVRFQYPIQTDDILTVEVSEDRLKWYDITGNFLNSGTTYNVSPWTYQNGVISGFGRLQQVSSTDVKVDFGQYAFASSTYATAGTAWSGGAGAAYWRVRKAKASSPVGFGLAGTDGSSGLYKAGQAPGLVTGATIASGYVGETKTWTSAPVSQTLTTSEADWTNATFTLTPGVWQIFYHTHFDVVSGSTAGNSTYAIVKLTDSSNTVIDNTQSFFRVSTSGSASTNLQSVVSNSAVVNISSSTTYKLRAYRTDASGTGSGSIKNVAGPESSKFYAVRIA
jgi:hypothetical protein